MADEPTFTLTVQAEVDADTIVQNDDLDLVELLVQIDAKVGETEFTLDLLERLITGMLPEDFEGHEQRIERLSLLLTAVVEGIEVLG